MTEDEARGRLERMVQSEIDPVLSFTEIEDLLELAKREDSEGRAPSNADWEPTFDLNPAAAEGWRWKAGKSVPRFGVNLDGATLHRQQVYAHCLKQADEYARRVIGTIGVASVAPLTASEFQVEE